jgi:hypothetical protein
MDVKKELARVGRMGAIFDEIFLVLAEPLPPDGSEELEGRLNRFRELVEELTKESRKGRKARGRKARQT